MYKTFLLFALVCCSGSPTHLDATTDRRQTPDHVLDHRVSAELRADAAVFFVSADMQHVDTSKWVCSPPGVYTIKIQTHSNNCPDEVGIKESWSMSKKFESMRCAMHQQQETVDQYWYVAKFIHRINATPYGLKLWGSCRIEFFAGLEDCGFGYSSAVTAPLP